MAAGGQGSKGRPGGYRKPLGAEAISDRPVSLEVQICYACYAAVYAATQAALLLCSCERTAAGIETVQVQSGHVSTLFRRTVLSAALDFALVDQGQQSAEIRPCTRVLCRFSARSLMAQRLRSVSECLQVSTSREAESSSVGFCPSRLGVPWGCLLFPPGGSSEEQSRDHPKAFRAEGHVHQRGLALGTLAPLSSLPLKQQPAEVPGRHQH